MVEVAVFAVVLAVMFVAKVVSVVMTRDEIVEKSASFSWVDPQEPNAIPAWETEATAKSSERSVAGAGVGVYGRRARVA